MVRFEFLETDLPALEPNHIGLTDAEIVELMSCQNRVGYWRSDLQAGQVFWSRNLFEIYGMDHTDGPISLTLANNAMHPEDLPYMFELLERAAKEKSGFHYILRLRNGHNGFKYVRSVGRFRLTPDGREELYGLCEEVFEQVRLVGVIGVPSAAG